MTSTSHIYTQIQCVNIKPLPVQELNLRRFTLKYVLKQNSGRVSECNRNVTRVFLICNFNYWIYRYFFIFKEELDYGVKVFGR